MKTAEDIAGEAYQIIGLIAADAGTFNAPYIQRALNYFAGDYAKDGVEILPWPGAGQKGSAS